MNELTNGSVFVLNCKTCLLCASFGEFVATFRKICTVGSFDINALFLFGIVDKASEPPDKIAVRESNNSFPFENSIFFSLFFIIIIIGQNKRHSLLAIHARPEICALPRETSSSSAIRFHLLIASGPGKRRIVIQKTLSLQCLCKCVFCGEREREEKPGEKKTPIFPTTQPPRG